jgi:exosortase
VEGSERLRTSAQSSSGMGVRHVTFLLLCGAGLAFLRNPLAQLLGLSFHNELYSHIPLIPFISAFVLYVRRKKIFVEPTWNRIEGFLLIAAGGALLYAGESIVGLKENDHLAVVMSGAVLWFIGSFVLAYGSRAFKEAMFPLLFLVFVIPLPTPILDFFVGLLRSGSAHAAYLVFRLTGVPVWREGFVFSLPGVTIEVAEQCSGIRSSLALVITSVLAGYLFLGEGWSRGFLVLSVFPITVFKNALRIVTLSLLAAYVDPRFITGSWLHHSGGILFFAAGLILILPVLWGLRKAEKKPVSSKQ